MMIPKLILQNLVKNNKNHQNSMKNQENLKSQINNIKIIIKMVLNQKRVKMKRN